MSVSPVFDPDAIKRGGDLFKKNCASCHGRWAQGSFSWRKTGKDGKYPPPPLNGRGHTWHHSKAQIKQTIIEGTIGTGGNMPAWKDKLSDREIEDMIVWIQSMWPDKIYSAWQEMNTRKQVAK